MKKTILTLALLGGMVFGGCIRDFPTDPTDPTFVAQVDEVKRDVKAQTNLASIGVLLAIDGDDRAKVAREANRVAKDVKKALSDETLNLKGVRELAIKLVADSDSEDKELVAMFLNSAITLVESELNMSFEIPLPQELRESVGKELALSAVEAIIEVTQPFVQ